MSVKAFEAADVERFLEEVHTIHDGRFDCGSARTARDRRVPVDTAYHLEAVRDLGSGDRRSRGALGDGEEVPHVLNFQDASRLQRILTPRRLELIRSLMNEPANSIRDLADRLDRDVRQVHDDVQLLGEYRIVRLKTDGSAKRPVVPYETVRIEVELEVSSAGDGESSGTDSDSSAGSSHSPTA